MPADALPGRAPVMHKTLVWLELTTWQLLPPNCTCTSEGAAEKPVPCSVTSVPPAVLPAAGLMAETLALTLTAVGPR